MTETSLVPANDSATHLPPMALNHSTVDAMPTIAEIRHRMSWMEEFRPVLLEFVQKQMDPRRHMYTFDQYNKYTSLDTAKLKNMIEEGKRPALNQDGIHNLMSLYEVHVDEPLIEETRTDGHYSCRVTVKLMSFRTGTMVGSGVGYCSTRESKYAYRWVSKNRLPKGINAASLKQQERNGSSGPYTVYRLDNEDLADVENTVLKMSFKRAKSSAVAALPMVSEIFASFGDPDEEDGSSDSERQELLRTISAWLKSIPAQARTKAILAVFSEPLTANDIPNLDAERLRVATNILNICQQVNWSSSSLVADIKATLAASAQKAQADLFGATKPDTSATPATPNAAWRDVIYQHMIAPDNAEELFPRDVYEECMTAYHGNTTNDQDGDKLAQIVLDWVNADS